MVLDVDRAVDNGGVVFALAAVLQHIWEAALALLGHHDEAEDGDNGATRISKICHQDEAY